MHSQPRHRPHATGHGLPVLHLRAHSVGVERSEEEEKEEEEQEEEEDDDDAEE